MKTYNQSLTRGSAPFEHVSVYNCRDRGLPCEMWVFKKKNYSGSREQTNLLLAIGLYNHTNHGERSASYM